VTNARSTAVPPTPEPLSASRRPNNLVGVAILAIWLALGAAIVRQPSGPAVFGFVMFGWILAVMAHEFSHAGVAFLAGDHTVADKGYLSFDPRRYGDLGTSLVIPLLALMLGGIGFPGGAVYLRHDLMRSKAWRAAASLAGPGATLVVLLALSFILSFWRGWGVEGDGPRSLYNAVSVIAFLQAMALILNLLPFPGLDGFNAIQPFLPRSWAPAIRKGEGLAMLVLIAFIFIVPGASAALFRAAAVVGQLLGLEPQAMQDGWDAFHFWK
jgi:Zn-dependent protease